MGFAQTTSPIKNYVVQGNYMFGKQEDFVVVTVV